MTGPATENSGDRHAAAVDLCVLDFGRAWDRWQQMGAPAPPGSIHIQTTNEVLSRSAGVLLITVPPEGLDSTRRRCVDGWVARGTELFFAASIAPEQLQDGGRENVGYIDLRNEIFKDFGKQLVTIPQVESKEASFAKQLMAVVETRIEANLQRAGIASDESLVSEEVQAVRMYHQEPMESLAAALLDLTETQRAEALIALLDDLERRKSHVLDLRNRSERILSHLIPEVASACRHATHKVPIMHGKFAENIVMGVAEVAEDVRKLLQADEWQRCEIGQLAAWRDQTLKEFESSGMTLPLVGLYSSGKTTLLNHILGSTPNGQPLLRTSKTHNTALLACFHYGNAGQQRVELTYRTELTQLPLWLPGTPGDRVVSAPCDGLISKVLKEDGDTTVIVTRSSDGTPMPVRIEAPCHLLNGVRVARRVSDGEPLSSGVSPLQLQEKTLKDLDAIVTIEGVLIKHVIALIERKKIIRPRFEVLFRSAQDAHGFKLSKHVFNERNPDELRGWMRWLKRIPFSGATPLNEIKAKSQPIEIYFSAKVNAPQCVAGHALETDKDWDWFQGAVVDQESKVETRKGGPEAGFAEGPEAELLVQKADIYLNGPLFRLINIVDTPGLNSVTRMHSITTEEFIKLGHVFLILLKLQNGADNRSNKRLFEMVRDSLSQQDVPSSEHKDHIFIVLNRWERVGDESSLREIKKVEKLAADVFEDDAPLYVVDLKQQNSADSLTEELLGRQSISPLFRDLRCYVASRGVVKKLTTRQDKLNDAWKLAKRLHKQERADMDGVAVEETAIALTAAKVAIKKAVAAALTYAQARIDRVRDAAIEVDNIFDHLGNKASFVSAQSDYQLLDYFNTAREDLKKSIAPHVRSLIHSALKELIDVPQFEDIDSWVNGIRVLSSSSFQSDIDDIVATWPGKWEGFKNFFKRVFDSFDFVRHGERKREQLRSDHFPESKHRDIRKALDALQERIASNLEEIEEDALRKIEKRESNLKPQRSQLAKRQQAWEQQGEALQAFSPVYKKACHDLEQLVTHLRSILEKE
jgi:hypothetical protein